MNLIHSEVRLEGLETLDYRDNLCPEELFTEQGDAITFETEVNLFMQPKYLKRCDYRCVQLVKISNLDFNNDSI